MGNKTSYQLLINNSYSLDEKFLRNFYDGCDDRDYTVDDFLDIVNIRSEKIITNSQRDRPRSRNTLVDHYNHCVAAVILLEHHNVRKHPETRERWSVLVGRLQQIVGIFGSLNDPQLLN